MKIVFEAVVRTVRKPIDGSFAPPLLHAEPLGSHG